MRPSNGTTIMLVDDEEDIREVLGISLADMGYRVVTAGSGKDALALFNKEKPPIVLTDIKMPDMEGVDLLRAIKKDVSNTEVIMITGHADMNLAIKSLRYGAIDFITKPINDEVLEIALKRANERITTRRQLCDYTERLENLLQEKTMLQDHLSSLGLMIGSISHGIKGLLTRMDGGLYLLESALKKKEIDEINNGLDISKQTVGRIKKMVLDILYYAKERELKIEKVNILKFANDVADIIEQKIKGHKIQFTREFEKDAGKFEIDKEYLHSAMINILDNAVDACTEDKEKSSHRIAFGMKQDNGQIALDVYDNGIGMDSKTKEKIFNLFFSSKGSKGTGLGLFISTHIIKQHKGTINVNSTAHKGTHFIVKIPKVFKESPQ